MSRGQGRVYRRGSVWWLDYTVGGKRHRYPANSATTSKEANAELRKSIGDREAGKVIGRPDKVTLADLKAGLERHYKRENNRSWTSAQYSFKHLERLLGAMSPVSDLTPSRLNWYTERRFEEGAARATVRTEIANLSSAFTVAVVEDQVLAHRPTFQLPTVRNARSGFFTQGDVAALLLGLPEFPYNQIVRLASFIGWRRAELFGLSWDQIDRESKVLRIHPPTDAKRTKGEDARTIPYGGTPIEAILDDCWAQRSGPFVFHRNGQRVRTFYKAWNRACKRAGLVGRRLHDFRRTAARDLINAGVPDKVVCQVVGWRPGSQMLTRYHIVNEGDVAQALAKRFTGVNGTVAAQNSVPASSTAT